MPVLILMQGVPGSGKSTEAYRLKGLCEIYHEAKIVSTDDFHTSSGFDWCWQPESLPWFHAWNQWEADYWMSRGFHVIVDNCNILRLHAQPYVDLIKKHPDYALTVHRCVGEHKSVHGVPAEIIEWMRSSMENLL